jgi:hypothetical protein
MVTAIQVGLVPGFALQDGDKLARLLSGSLGLGATSSTNFDLSKSGSDSIVGATQIVSTFTIINNVDPAHDSIQLAGIAVGAFLRIFNNSENVVYVFPPEGQSIDGAPVDTAVWLSGGARCDYYYMGDGTWVSDLLGTKSA